MSSLLDKDLIFLQSNAKHHEDVFNIFGEVMINKGYANANYIKGLIEREHIFPTGLSTETSGIALPHTDASFVKESKIGFMLLENPVEFGVMGGDANDTVNVSIVFLLGLADGNKHLQVLQKVIELIQDDDFIQEMKSLHSKEEVYQLLNGKLVYQLEEEVK